MHSNILRQLLISIALVILSGTHSAFLTTALKQLFLLVQDYRVEIRITVPDILHSVTSYVPVR